MLSLTEIKSAVQSAIDQYGEPERAYSHVISVDNDTEIEILIRFICGVKFDKEPDPQISKEPLYELNTSTEHIPVFCNERVIKAFVRAMIEEIEETKIRYE